MKKLFLHMPKCAGASVKKILENSPAVSLRLDYESFFKIPKPERNAALLSALFQAEALEEGKIVYGHFFPIKYIGSGGAVDFKLVTILRDPISRLKSHYLFWKSGDYSDHHIWRKMKSENWTFEQFAFSDEMRNIYAQYFSGIGLNAFSYIGIFENIIPSVAGCLATLGVDIGASLALPNENVTAQKETMNISPDVARKLRDHHADDYLVYEFARKKFHPSLKRGFD